MAAYTQETDAWRKQNIALAEDEMDASSRRVGDANQDVRDVRGVRDEQKNDTFLEHFLQFALAFLLLVVAFPSIALVLNGALAFAGRLVYTEENPLSRSSCCSRLARLVVSVRATTTTASFLLSFFFFYSCRSPTSHVRRGNDGTPRRAAHAFEQQAR